MNKKVRGKSILYSQRQAIQERILRVPRASIYIMYREDIFLAQHPVEHHQEGSIKQLEFVVPENVKYLRFSMRSIPEQSHIKPQNPNSLLCETGVRPLISPEI